MFMPSETTKKVFNALYPEELLERYSAGERNFARINLLRKELEHILGPTADTDLIKPAYKWLDKFNILWADYRNPLPLGSRFEWDRYGSFIPVELDDSLPERNLSNANLSGINLEGSYLYPVNFCNANLAHANLRNTILHDVNLQGADLSHTDLRRSVVRGNLQGVNLSMARLEGCDLSGCNLQGANLQRTKLQKANLAGADMRQANLSKAHFERTVLNEAKLQGVDFKDVTLNSVYVTGVTLTISQQSDFLQSLRVRLSNA